MKQTAMKRLTDARGNLLGFLLPTEPPQITHTLSDRVERRPHAGRKSRRTHARVWEPRA